MIKDFIYFDLEKGLSILSQLDGKLVTEINEQIEESKDERNIRQYDVLKMFKPEFGGIKYNRNSILQTGIMHHNVFNLLERRLKENNLLINVNRNIEPNGDVNFLSAALQNSYYIVAEGYAKIEDFTKIDFILSRFNDVSSFISKCSLTEKSNELMKEIDDKKSKAMTINDKGKRKNMLKSINQEEKQLKDNIDSWASSNNLPEWFIDGIRLFIDTFLKERVLIRIYPYEERPQNHFVGNLKSDCFTDANINNIVNAYGTKPNVKLTMFGLITSAPTENGFDFECLDEYKGYDKLTDEMVFERAFRDIFRSMDGIEDYVKFTRFPNVTVYPIAVYRNISPR